MANAGLLLPATLARHLGLPELVRQRLDLGDAPGRANTSDKMMTLVASALAGGDCIDDADVLRTGGTACTLGGTVKAPSTLGTFLRSFRWGHVRQLDRVSRELLARAWQAGAGPGDGPLTIDLDSTICETYGLAKEGARHHGYTGKRGYHPLLAIAAGTGDVLMSRLSGQHRPRRRPLPAGDGGTGALRRGQRTTHATPKSWRGIRLPQVDVRFSITIRQHKSLPDTRRCLDADSLLDGRRRCGRDHLQGRDAAPDGSSSGGSKANTDHGFYGELKDLAATSRECHRHISPRPLRRTAPGWPSTMAQYPGERSHHPPAAVLLPGRTAHPLGTPVDPVIAGLGLRSSAAPCEPFHSRAAPSAPTQCVSPRRTSERVPCWYSLAIPRIATAIGAPVR